MFNRQTSKPLARAALLTTILLIGSQPSGAMAQSKASGIAKSKLTTTQLVGTWTIDVERTEAIQPEQPQEKNWFKNQNIRTSVSVAGMPLPNPRTKIGPISSHAPKDPDVLRCKELQIAPNGNGLRFTYVDVGSELRKQGAYRGAKIRWNKTKLTESYKSTERKVTQTYEIKDKDQLFVTVKINPYKGATRTYKQVFNRKPQ